MRVRMRLCVRVVLERAVRERAVRERAVREHVYRALSTSLCPH